jgi:methyl-accepting chemotaxis protein-1 (serine sensor receptor)
VEAIPMSAATPTDSRPPRRVSPRGGLALLSVIAVSVASLAFLSIGRGANQRAMQRVVETLDAADLAYEAQVQFKLQVQEWKNLLLRGHDPADFAAFAHAADAARQRVRSLLGEIARNALVDEAAQREAVAIAAEIDQIVDRYAAVLRGPQDLAACDAPRAIDATVRGIDRAPMVAIERLTDTLDALAREALVAAEAEDLERFDRFQRWLYGLCGVSIALSLVAMVRRGS